MLPELLNEQLRLVDGTIVKKCPTIKPLYCSKDGRFFSVHNMQITDEGCIMQELKPIFSPAMRVRNQNSAVNHGLAYPNMRHFGSRLCHHLVWETFVGPRTDRPPQRQHPRLVACEPRRGHACREPQASQDLTRHACRRHRSDNHPSGAAQSYLRPL